MQPNALHFIAHEPPSPEPTHLEGGSSRQYSAPLCQVCARRGVESGELGECGFHLPRSQSSGWERRLVTWLQPSAATAVMGSTEDKPRLTRSRSWVGRSGVSRGNLETSARLGKWRLRLGWGMGGGMRFWSDSRLLPSLLGGGEVRILMWQMRALPAM